MQWYLDALYLNQGIRSLRRKSGPGTSFATSCSTRAAASIEQGELPSRKEHWPRLRYHRHFMLADQAGLPSDDKQFSDYWQRKYLEAYARHLLRVNENAQAVRVATHSPLAVAARLTLCKGSKARRIRERLRNSSMEVTQRRSDLGPPADGSKPECGRAAGIEHGRPLDGRPAMIAATRSYVAEVWEAWNEFWFTPTSPSTLSAIRVLAGAMLLYTHLVWSFDLTRFFGPNGWLPPQLMHDVHNAGNDPDGPGPLTGAPRFIWSHFNYIQSPKLMWTVHIVGAGRVLPADDRLLQPHDGASWHFCLPCRTPIASRPAPTSAWTKSTACWRCT